MARTRSTPYPTQLKKFLTALNGDRRTFSAAALVEEFDHPHQQRLGSKIGGIHKALMHAFAAGDIISFVDDDGCVLREKEIAVPGSKAIGQPQIFATKGTPSPEDGYRQVTYEEFTHRAGAVDADDDADGDVDEIGEPDDETADGDRTGEPASRADEEPAATAALSLTPHAAGARYRAYLDRPGPSAPEWVPLSALRVWAAAPAVIATIRRIVQDGPMIERLALIQAGVPRKGEISPASAAARGVALLCRRPGIFWAEVFRGATRQYIDDGQSIDEEQVARFAADPVGYYLETDRSPFLLLMCGVALGLDLDVLRELIEECDDAIGADTADEEPARAEERIAQLDSMLADARKAVKDAEKEVKKADRRIEGLTRELQRARETAHEENGEALAAEQEARQSTFVELTAVKTELEEARVDATRAHELEAEVEALQRSRDALLSEERSIENERRLREEIEAQMQDQMRQLTELRAQLRNQNALPTSDGPALLRALARSVGDAARLAGERLAEGRSLPGDEQLLSFAATVMQTANAMAAMSATAASPTPAVPAAPETPTDPTPMEATTEVAVAEPAAADAKVAMVAESDGPLAPAEEAVEPQPARRRRGRQQTWFTVRPVGGAREIGGSAILIETQNHHRVLLDAGQRVKGEYGLDTTHLFHRGLRGVDHLHGILISHAHIDHVGSLPPVWEYHSAQQDADVPIWMTAPTKDLARIMLKDSAKIQNARDYERDALAESDFGAPMDAVYTEPQVNQVLDVIQTVQAYQPTPITGTSLVAHFLPVSHVLGSCAVHLRDTESGQTLLYTGDIGPISQPQLTLPDFGGTELIQRADTIIMESTYGVLTDSEREGRKRSGLHGREREVHVLFANARQALERGGFVLMPSFSLGRTQELVRLIGDHMEDAKIYMAGMGETIFEVYDQYQRKDGGMWLRPGRYPDTDAIGRRMRGYTIEEKVESVLEGDPGFIIASPAMLSGGWSRAFMERMIGDERHAIIFSGYLPRHGTDIPRLRELGKNRTVKLGGVQVTIHCDWWRVGLSAHAPAEDLRRFAREMAAGADHVHFGLVHGEASSQRDLAADIAAIDNATGKSLSNGEPWTPGRP
jgi:Cft2 family RNA processing exonuclease